MTNQRHLDLHTHGPFGSSVVSISADANWSKGRIKIRLLGKMRFEFYHGSSQRPLSIIWYESLRYLRVRYFGINDEV